MSEKKDFDSPQKAKVKKYPHEGHRERMRKRFRASGLVGFTDFEVLELFLFYVIPRRDTRPTAHLLLEEFGSLTAVFNAPEDKLCKVPGVGPKTASYIHSVRMFWMYLKRLPAKSYPVSGIADMLKWVEERLAKLRPPLYFIVLLNDFNEITYYNFISGQDLPTFATLLRTIGVRTEGQMAIVEWGTATSHAITEEHTVQVRALAENLKRLGYFLWDYIALPALNEKPFYYRRRGQLIGL